MALSTILNTVGVLCQKFHRGLDIPARGVSNQLLDRGISRKGLDASRKGAIATARMNPFQGPGTYRQESLATTGA